MKILTVHTMSFSVRSAYNYDVRSDKIKYFNPIALRKTKVVYNFGLSECNRIKLPETKISQICSEDLDEVAVFKHIRLL